MAHDVFISHSSKDKTIADAVCHELEGRGIRCWIAPRDILAGVSYPKALIQGLNGSRLLVLVFSAHANGSDDVAKEVERACSKGLAVVPFRLEDVPMSEDLEYHLSSVHWLDAITPPLEEHLAHLADTVGLLLEQMAKAPTSPSKTSDAPTPTVAAETQSASTTAAAAPHKAGDTPAPPRAPTERSPSPAPALLPLDTVEFVPRNAAPSSRAPSLREQWCVDISGLWDGVTFSPDGHTIVTAGHDGRIYLWNAAKGSQQADNSDADKNDVFTCAFSPDGRTLATASRGNTIELRDVATGLRKATLTGHEHFIRAAIFSPDGRSLVSVSEDKTLRLWDVASRRCLATLSGHKSGVNACAFSPDGMTIASGSHGKVLKLWDVASRTCRATLSGHESDITACAFLPDGLRLVSASTDRTLKLWNVADHTCLATLAGHERGVNDCDVSRDGNMVVSAGTLSDATLRLWDVSLAIRGPHGGTAGKGETGRACRTVVTPHISCLSIRCAFSPDGRRIVSLTRRMVPRPGAPSNEVRLDPLDSNAAVLAAQLKLWVLE